MSEWREAKELSISGERTSGFHDDGIRGHQSRSLSTTPLGAWYRGPFMPLFQTDFRNGVVVLNRMPNHAPLEAAIFNYIDAFADNATLLGSFLRALSAAAEESALRAVTARRVWPAIIERVLEANASGHALVADGYFGGMTTRLAMGC